MQEKYSFAVSMQASVEFHVNASYEKILELLAESVAGLNTMVDEHFGISVVEYMAAGIC